MSEPLALAYAWRTPVFFSTLAAILCLGVVIQGQGAGWPRAVALVVVLWAVLMGVLGWRTRAYLRVDGDRLTVRRFRRFSTVTGADVVAVAEQWTPSGPSYRLTVRGADGTTRRLVVPVALLRDGRSTLFAWILATAPQAELDAGSQRAAEVRASKGRA